MGESKADVIARVKACLRSDRDYELYKPRILEKVKASDKTYYVNTVDVIKKVIKDKKEDGLLKLSALFLLKEVMDTKNPELVAYTHKKILDRLGIIAKGKPNAYFPKDTSEAMMEQFSQLLIECITKWNEWFGVDNNNKPTKYRTVFNDVKSKVKIPARMSFFTEPIREPGSRVDNQRQPSQPDLSPAVDSPPRTGKTVNKPIEETKEDAFLENIDEILVKIDTNKRKLLNTMMIEDEPDRDAVTNILTQLKGSNKELQNSANELAVRDFPNKEEVVEQVLSDSDLITQLISGFQKVHKNQSSFEEYREYVIEVLSEDLQVPVQKPVKSAKEEPPKSQSEVSEKPPNQPSRLSVDKPLDPYERSPNDIPARSANRLQDPSPAQTPLSRNDGNMDRRGSYEREPVSSQMTGARNDENTGRRDSYGREPISAQGVSSHNGMNQDTRTPLQREPNSSQKVETPALNSAQQPNNPAGVSYDEFEAVPVAPEATEGRRARDLNQSNEFGRSIRRGTETSFRSDGERKAPKSFKDLFSATAATGSKANRSSPSMQDIKAKKQAGPAKSRFVADQSLNSSLSVINDRLKKQDHSKQPEKQKEFGIDDFENLPANATGTIEDSSVMSKSGAFNFDYDNKGDRSAGLHGDDGIRGRRRIRQNEASRREDSNSKFSPDSHILGDYGRGTADSRDHIKSPERIDGYNGDRGYQEQQNYNNNGYAQDDYNRTNQNQDWNQNQNQNWDQNQNQYNNNQYDGGNQNQGQYSNQNQYNNNQYNGGNQNQDQYQNQYNNNQEYPTYDQNNGASQHQNVVQSNQDTRGVNSKFDRPEEKSPVPVAVPVDNNGFENPFEGGGFDDFEDFDEYSGAKKPNVQSIDQSRGIFDDTVISSIPKNDHLFQSSVSQIEVRQSEIRRPENGQSEFYPEIKRPEIRPLTIQQPETRSPQIQQANNRSPQIQQANNRSPQIQQANNRSPAVKSSHIQKPLVNIQEDVIIEQRQSALLPEKKEEVVPVFRSGYRNPLRGSTAENNMERTLDLTIPRNESALNLSTASEDVHIRQAESLLEKARRITSQKNTLGLYGPGYVGQSVLSGDSVLKPFILDRPVVTLGPSSAYGSAFIQAGYNPAPLEPPQRESHRITMAPLYPVISESRRLSVDRNQPLSSAALPNYTVIEPYARRFSFDRNTSLTGALLTDPLGRPSVDRGQPYSSALNRPPPGEGLLREIRHAQDLSQSFNSALMSPRGRALSEQPSRLISMLPPKYLNEAAHDVNRSRYDEQSTLRHEDSYVHGGRDSRRSSFHEDDKYRSSPKRRGDDRYSSKTNFTGNFPGAHENRELNKAVELIEKARRLREKRERGIDEFAKDLKTRTSPTSPKIEKVYSESIRDDRYEDRVHSRKDHESRNLHDRSYESSRRGEDLRRSGVYERDRDHYIKREERRTVESDRGLVTFYNNGRNGARGHLETYEPRNTYNTPAYGMSPRHNKINTSFDERDLRSHERFSVRNDHQLSERGRQHGEKKRIIGPDGKVYEEVVATETPRRHISEEPKLFLSKRYNEVQKSPKTGDVQRGRSYGKKYEPFAHVKQASVQNEFPNTRVTRKDLKPIIKRNSVDMELAHARLTFAAPGNNFIDKPSQQSFRNIESDYRRLQPHASPDVQRNEAHKDFIELQPNQSTKIVERPVPGVSTKVMRDLTKTPAIRDRIREPEKSPVRARAEPVLETKPQIPPQSQQLASMLKDEIAALKKKTISTKKKEPERPIAEVKAKEILQSTIPKNNKVWVNQTETKLMVNEPRREKTKMNVAADFYDTVPRKGPRTNSEDVILSNRHDYPEDGKNTKVRVLYEDPSRGKKVMSESFVQATPVLADVVTASAVLMTRDNNRGDRDPRDYRSGRKESTTGNLRDLLLAEDLKAFDRKREVKEIDRVQGVKMTMDTSSMWSDRSIDDKLSDSRYLQNFHSGRDLQREVLSGRNSILGKVKSGRTVSYDYYLFDQITNAIYSNAQGKDIDTYKNACLTNKAVLQDSPYLKADVITRLEESQEGSLLRIIIHYLNKSSHPITGMNGDCSEYTIEQNPSLRGMTLAPKQQLKQELFLDFFKFKPTPYTIKLSFQHENALQHLCVALPLGVNKFMQMRVISANEHKRRWKGIKQNVMKSKYKHINAKFIRSQAEVNKYFDNALVDVASIANPKKKKKYGGVFVFPDKKEYLLKVSLDPSRAKFFIGTETGKLQYCDWAVQFLSFLLTV